MIKNTVIFVIIVLIGGALYYIGQQNIPSKIGYDGPKVITVVTAPVRQEIFTDKIEALGTTKANESVNLTATTTDKISKINFTDGMTVQKGHVIAELVSDEEIANLHSAKINAEQQKRDLNRIEGLVKSRTLPTARLDDQRTLYRKAKTDIEVAQSRIRDRKIVAPFDGQLGVRQVSLGALVTPGTVITTLDDLSIIKLDFTVPEGFLAVLKKGQNITALTDAYPKITFTGRVTNIGSRVDPISRAVMVRAIIPNDKLYLRPGMLMRVSLIKAQGQTLMIPEEALMTSADRKYVFLVQNGTHVIEQNVVIGRRRPGAVEIKKGLRIGQKVVTEGAIKLQNNSMITIQGSGPTSKKGHNP